MSLVVADNIEKQYPIGDSFLNALKGINLTIQQGEFTGVVGPSGSGKTTLLNLIGCLDIATKGELTVLGHQANALSHEEASMLRNKNIGFIFQSYNLFPYYTVFENVEFPLLLLKYPKLEREKMINDALDWIGLHDKKHVRPARLSGGQCQRVAIARAIVKKPKMILADEPTANLDTENSMNILSMMKKMNKELNTTFIFSTHDDKVINLLDRTLNLVDGQIVSDRQS